MVKRPWLYIENVVKNMKSPWKAKIKEDIWRKHNMPKPRPWGGKGTHRCVRCGKLGKGIITKYGLYLCRQCFREVAEELGFKIYGHEV